ncbi:MAG: (d)CMP kinase [Gammaproteobacteria bacterium]|nr:(d)CMP kinase [Gammaproteobacteria bacterium]MYF58718.1 (d)CMP kinase [Gammaproteobacteria bacterium]
MSRSNNPPAQAPVVAIDGPAAAGKGVIARYLAERLGWRRLDSGALYRAVSLSLLRAGLVHAGEERIAAHLADSPPELEAAHDGEMIYLNGENVSSAIREEETGVAASVVAPLPAVRNFLLKRQRAFRRAPGLVAEGRDMASVVFPGAELQIYLTATPEERARRRHKQLKQKGINANMRDLIRDLTDRDLRDSARTLAPLKVVPHAVVLDTTKLDIRQTRKAAWRLVTEVWPEKADR